MRELNLQQLISEMHGISDRGEYTSQRFQTVLDKIRQDLKRWHGERDAATAPEPRPLSGWWSVYPGLSTYIYR